MINNIKILSESQPFDLRRDYLKLLGKFSTQTQSRSEIIRIDLHCHDLNSNKSDEPVAASLDLPETWLETEELLDSLRRNDTDAVTITNHNNAKSIWQLKEKGMDVLSAAEFTCTLIEENIQMHVLTYGFTPAQEEKLSVLRKNMYKFLGFCAEHDLPTVLAHPLYFYNKSKDGSFSKTLMDRLLLLFSRFEGINGHREAMQNLTVCRWIENADEEAIRRASKRIGLSADAFCKNPYVKTLTGGSDDHMGIVAGSFGTSLHVPDLKNLKSQFSMSELALKALRENKTMPYGYYDPGMRLPEALLDFVCQAFVKLEDPGLLSIVSSKGSWSEKVTAVLAANLFMELRRHKTTGRFLETFHDALHGRRPWISRKYFVHPEYRPLIAAVEDMSRLKESDAQKTADCKREAFEKIFRELTAVIAGRAHAALKNSGPEDFKSGSIPKLPTHVRKWLAADEENGSTFNVLKALDKLSFPLLAGTLLSGTVLGANRAQHSEKKFADDFAAEQGLKKPGRVLWLTDTFGDANGVSMSLGNLYTEVCDANLPIDFLVCKPGLQSAEHLHALEPVYSFKTEFYPDQDLNVPDLLAVERIFREGGYTQVISSTEFFMGAVALWLKGAFRCEAHLFLHTDWIEFARSSFGFQEEELSRLDRMITGYYGMFDSLLVLNDDHREDLMRKGMKSILRTRHWVDDIFQPQKAVTSVFARQGKDIKHLLYAGRLSEEKGVMQLKVIADALKDKGLNVHLTVIGKGPAEEKMRASMPEATFIPWCEQEKLPGYLSSADLLLFPSVFDTFGRVVLEAVSCGLPVAAYNCKGPKGILTDKVSGILAEDLHELIERSAALLLDEKQLTEMKEASITRSKLFSKTEILSGLLQHFSIPHRVLPEESIEFSGVVHADTHASM